MTMLKHRLGDVDDLHAFVDSLNGGGGWCWAKLPGLKVAYPEESRSGGDIYFLKSGMMSVGQEYVPYVLEAVRLGLSMVDWLYNNPALFGDRFLAAQRRASGKSLCERCDGTGNELVSMYKRCVACDGSGVVNA